MNKRQVAVITHDGAWRIYEQGGVYSIYHEFWRGGKKHKYIDGAGSRYNSLSEALATVASYISERTSRQTW